MKKMFMGLLVGFLLCISASVAYADSVQAAQVEICITGDLDFQKEKVSTFNDSKTISGTAEKGTAINIVVYTKSRLGKLTESENYSVEVGDSNLFSQAVGLSLGENYIEFKASMEGLDDYEGNVTVSRKNKAIKTQLENSIYIPGGSL
ncbi:MAG: hypothetical protein VB018_06300 [Lachnospiraceae bacterium]|nr:hypothetical protein [Lachnospiraceae bacterium]